MNINNLKNVFALSVLVVLAALSSCDNEGMDPLLVDDASTAVLTEIDSTVFGSANMDDWTEVDGSQVPQSVLDYVSENYPGEEIEHLWVDDQGGFVVLLDRGIALRFDSAGTFVEAITNAKRRKYSDDDRSDIAISNLPQVVLDYLSNNYSNYNIEEAEVDSDGNFHVELENGSVVIFDANGIFIEERACRNNDNDDRGRNDDWTIIDIVNLPSAITDYIATNYPDATIVRAGINDDGEYGVVLDSALALLFDANGDFKNVHEFGEEKSSKWTAIDVSSLPAAITEYILTNYPDASILRVGRNTKGEFGVVLDAPIILLFDAAGNFIRSDEFGHDDDNDSDDEGDYNDSDADDHNDSDDSDDDNDSDDDDHDSEDHDG